MNRPAIRGGNNGDDDYDNDAARYEQIAEEAGGKFMKNCDQNELKFVKHFITKVNNGTINDKNKAANEFRELKQKVNDQILKQELIKYLEKYLFGENLENIEPAKTFAPPSPPKEDYSAETDEYLKYLEEQEKDRNKFSDEYYSSGSGLNKKGKGLKILTNKQMLNRLSILLAQYYTHYIGQKH